MSYYTALDFEGGKGQGSYLLTLNSPPFAFMKCRSNPSCERICQDARSLWLNEGNLKDKVGTKQSHPVPNAGDEATIMAHVESMYRRVLDRIDCCEQRDMKEKLALILLQSGRQKEADAILESLGFTCRLALNIFKYDDSVLDTNTQSRPSVAPNSYCRVFDNALSGKELLLLQKVFADINGSYWMDHKYQVEPPSPYYSYVLPLKEAASVGTIDAVIHRLRNCLQIHFPALKSATSAEVWAHNRPHATGHQFHFDSDNEGCTEIIRNPIVSCVLYLSDGVGGPTAVTNQRLSSHGLASTAWMVPATISNRLVAFDGKLLHGVLPGTGSSPDRRVSLMIAFWKSLRVRDERGSAACRWPTPSANTWADALMAPSPSSESVDVVMEEVLPIVVSPVYEAIPGGEPWRRSKGMPDYELLFQGM